MHFKPLALFCALCLPIAGHTQSRPADFPQAKLTSEVIYTAPEGGRIDHWRGSADGMAILTGLDGEIEVFISTGQTRRFDGYWVESTGRPASRGFYAPMGDGDVGVFSVGDNAGKNNIYWAPPPADGWVDHSKDLIWSDDGSAAAVKTMEDGELYIYRNTDRFGPYGNVFFPRFTHDNELLYLAQSNAGEFVVYKDGAAMSDPLADVARIISLGALGGEGYLYGVEGENSFWALHNGAVVTDTSGPVSDFVLSPDGQHWAYFLTDPASGEGVEPVIDGIATGIVFARATPVSFARDGAGYVLAGIRADDAGEEKHFFYANGAFIGPYDGFRGQFYFRPGTDDLLFAAVSSDQTSVIAGDAEIGIHPVASSPYSSPDGAHLAYSATNDEQAEIIYLDGEVLPTGGEGLTGISFLTDAGDFHYTLRMGDSVTRMLNDKVIGNFEYVSLEQMSADAQDVVFAAPGGAGEVLYLNNAPLLTVKNAYMTAYAHIAGEEVLLSRLFEDEGEYLLIGDQIAGPYDQVMLSWEAIAEKSLPEFTFYTRTGEEVTRHLWLRN